MDIEEREEIEIILDLQRQVIELEADNEKLIQALKNIVQHQQIVAGAMAKQSATYIMAMRALWK